MTDEQANVRHLGVNHDAGCPVATHDVGCPIRGCPNPAVLSRGSQPLGSGVFEPCWRCQGEGWGLVQVTTKPLPVWPATITVLSSVGVVASVLTGHWGFVIINAALLGVGVMNFLLLRETRELKSMLRRRAELAGQVEHEGPPMLPPARVEERKP